MTRNNELITTIIENKIKGKAEKLEKVDQKRNLRNR